MLRLLSKLARKLRGEEEWEVHELPYTRIKLPNGKVIRAKQVRTVEGRKIIYLDPRGQVRVEYW